MGASMSFNLSTSVGHGDDSSGASAAGESHVVPSIDIAGWRSGSPARRHAIARQVDEACRQVGFMQVTGHGVDQQHIDRMVAAADAFFDLPHEVKLTCCPPRPEVNRGYAARGTEALGYSIGVVRPPDLFEAFNIGPEHPDLTDPAVLVERHRFFAPNIWLDASSHPTTSALMKQAFVHYMDASRRLADVLAEIFAVALGEPVDTFTSAMRHSTDTLRVIRYQTQPGDPEPLPGQIGMGEHTDYGLCTVLWAEPVPGLQILDPTGIWVDVQPRPGAFLVNLGDLLARWTNDRWRSTLHRVLPPVRDRHRVARRRSVALFVDADHDAVVSTLPSCIDVDHPLRYQSVTAGEHLLAKLLGPRTLAPSEVASTVEGRRTSLATHEP